MTFSKPHADTFIPDGSDLESALARTTHLAIGAHQDDLEIFAYHGIAECYREEGQWFTGVTVTNGSGSARTGQFADYTDEQMVEVRLKEQREAASLAEYSVQFQLGIASSEIKDPSNDSAVNDLLQILRKAQPEIVYLHNPADKHDTHIAVLVKCIKALRLLSIQDRPKKVYGCEVWRALDWLLNEDKVSLPCSKYPELALELVAVFQSQIAGGKRYDLASEGRRMANATYFDSHTVDGESALTFAVDLTPLMEDDTLTLKNFILPFIERLKADVAVRIDNIEGRS